MRAYQNLMQVDRDARIANQRRIRELSIDQASAVRIFCAHDAIEFEALTGG
ncbi:hypothetical protein [uncultured Sphingomonas sp.]|uniref:hypothetical protein n=1 Tax=uncultured Sphingomonas sp. TaxID=158754 RepID=UPI0035CB0E4F